MGYQEIIEKRRELREKAKLYTNYAIITVASLIALLFLPLLSSTIGLDWNLPDNEVGWIVYIVTRLSVAGINVLIFVAFMKQAKDNVKDDPNYLAAQKLLNEVKLKIYVPRSPAKFNRQAYGGKAVSIFISTALTTVALTQALLSYDYVTALTYLVTIIMGIVFGIFQMLTAEEYWTIEYLDYAKRVTQQINQENTQN